MMDRNTVLNCVGTSSDINEYLMTLYNLPVQIKAKTIVELGAGWSTVALTAAANFLDADFTSIDMGEGSWYRSNPSDAHIWDEEKRITRILGDDMTVYETWDKDIDFLFLDTSHTFDQTQRELAYWPRWVKPGGIFVMHDTAHESGDGMGCRQALAERMVTPTTAVMGGGVFTVVHLLDTKIIGLSVMVRLGEAK